MIEAHAEGRARAAESVAAEFSGDEPVISFNPVFLLDGLTGRCSGTAAPHDPRARPAMSAGAGRGQTAGAGQGGGDAAGTAGSGRIRLAFNTAAKPALITWTSDEERDGIPAFRYLLVPLRVPERS